MTRVRGMCASQPLELSSDRLKKKKYIDGIVQTDTRDGERNATHNQHGAVAVVVRAARPAHWHDDGAGAIADGVSALGRTQ